MNVIEAINQRYSCRAYKPEQVEQETLQKIMQAAIQSPSWANTQPWEVYVAVGQSLDSLRQGYLANFHNRVPINPDFPAPEEWPAHLKQRTEELAKKRLGFLGITREDKAARQKMSEEIYRFFGAPALITLCVDRNAPKWSLFDLGCFAQSLMLAAEDYGLSTIPAFMFAAYPELLRKELGIAAEHAVVIGIALGYGDGTQPTNQVRSDRRPAAEVVRFKGL